MTMQIEDGLRSIPEYEQVKLLVIEKKQLQARLREVDKILRKLDLFHPGIVGLSRQDLEHH